MSLQGEAGTRGSLLSFHIEYWKNVFTEKAYELYPSSDPSHDYLHIHRVKKIALALCEEEKAKIEVVMPAAFFHDFMNVPKNDPRRAQASQLSADAAITYLKTLNYPEEFFDDIKHAIAAHSFSAKIETKTIEAKIVQDADRLDSLGAMGIARLFATTTALKRPFYHLEDPWHEARELNDYEYALDHFYVKIFKLVDSLKTTSGRKEGQLRTDFMKNYLKQLHKEI